MDALVQQLGLNFTLVGIQLFGFILLFLLLKKFLWGRILGMIQQRGDEIRKAYEENENTRDAANELKAEYEKRLQEAKKEAESIVQKAVENAEKAGQEIVEKTRQEADQIKEKGLSEIELEKSRVLSELRTEVVELSMEIAKEIIEKTVDRKAAEDLTDNAIKRIGGVSFK
jgi:F-type H+-transporting ATPase subunit b